MKKIVSVTMCLLLLLFSPLAAVSSADRYPFPEHEAIYFDMLNMLAEKVTFMTDFLTPHISNANFPNGERTVTVYYEFVDGATYSINYRNGVLWYTKLVQDNNSTAWDNGYVIISFFQANEKGSMTQEDAYDKIMKMIENFGPVEGASYRQATLETANAHIELNLFVRESSNSTITLSFYCLD